MILEWIQSQTTEAPEHIRSLGMVHEAVAIEARFRRCSHAWESHLRKTKHQILQVIAGMEPGGEVIVLGSGGLHDIPLEDLAEHFDRVRLWDVVHLRQALRTAERFRNVECETFDVTALCKDFDSWLKGYRRSPPKPQIPDHLPTRGADLIISLNLLSQLPIQLMARARTPKRRKSLAGFADELMRAHVSWLMGHDCPVLLVTDLERQYETGRKIKVEKALPEHDLGLEAPLDTWMWTVCPEGESSQFDKIAHRVSAFLLD